MTSMLPLLLMAAVTIVSSSCQKINPDDFQMTNDCSPTRPCFSALTDSVPQPPIRRWKKSADPQGSEPETTILETDEPTERLLQRFTSGDEEAELVEDNYEVEEGTRQKRRVIRVVIRICNRRTRRCKYIIVYRRVR